METAQFDCTVTAPDGAVLVVVEVAGDLAKASLLEDCQWLFLESTRQVTLDTVGVALTDVQGLQRLPGCAQRLRKKHAAR